MWGIGSTYDLQTYIEAAEVIGTMAEYGWTPVDFDKRTGVPMVFGVRPFRSDNGAWHIARAMGGWVIQRAVVDPRPGNVSRKKLHRLQERFPTPVALATWWEIKRAAERT